MVTYLRVAGRCLAVLLTCATAVAEQALELLPPVARGSTDVPYPVGAEGDAAVVLELVVEKDGSVSSATVIEGAAPFAEQARTAVLTWRFTPAQRDRQPVAARIRAHVAFHRAHEEPAPASAPIPPVEAKPVRSPEPSYEVTVLGTRREIGQTTLSKSDVREMPGAFGDAFRAIEALPGVTPLASGVPYFYVRGAPPNNTGYSVDGIRVPLLFHLGLGQSVIHPGLIDHVDFLPSAAPARHGGFAGAVIAGQTREPAPLLRGEANLRLVDVGALVEAPFAGDRGSVLVAGRYGYPGPVLSAVTDDLKIGYWDYQARVSWQLGSRDEVSVFAFGSHDYLASGVPSGDPSASKEPVEQLVSDFHRIDLRYDHVLTDGRVRFALTGGYDSRGAAPTYMTDRSLGARLEVEQDLTRALRFRGGADARIDHYGLDISEQNPREPAVPQSSDPPPTNISAGVYSDFVWRVAPRVELVPGVRFDVYASSRRNEPPSTRTRTIVPAVDPRLSARVTISRGVTWLSTLGLSHQYPSLRVGNVPALLVAIPGFPFGVRQLQTAEQASQGFELALPASLTLTATGFYSYFGGLTDLSAQCVQYEPGDSGPRIPGDPEPPYVCPNNEPVRGRAYGVELLLRRPFSERLSGSVSYTLSRTTREAHFLTPSGGDDVATVASDFDRTHVLNAILSYDLGRRWRLGTRLLFYTGTPYSRLDGSFPVPPYHAYRSPAFHRIDVRLEKRWQLGQTASVAFVLEGQNVTLRKESGLGLDCRGQGTPQSETVTCEPSTIGPITIPSVGLEAFF
jgi:hypothetical protein